MSTRLLNGLCLLLLTTFSQFVAASNACSLAPREPGTPIEAPHAVFDAYVIEVDAPRSSPTAFGIRHTRRALVEVVRSFHGPYAPGQQVETLTIERANGCGGVVESGAHVVVRSETGGPFEIIETLSAGSAIPEGPFAALAFAGDEQRKSLRPALKNASLRGGIDFGLAARLHSRARPGREVHSEISGAGNFAQVSWGKAFGGNDARHKVVFERTARGWVEILRYEAPTPTPVRNRGRRAKQRALWAEESFLRRPDAAWAATTS
ncbi:MAG TPA: hypothetical protein VIV63_09470 [Steroidobacteraceae bacterium]